MTTETHLSNLSEIKAKLEADERLTVMSVYRDLKTYELRHFIAQLKKVLPIRSEWKTNPANGKRFKEYYLDKAA